MERKHELSELREERLLRYTIRPSESELKERTIERAVNESVFRKVRYLVSKLDNDLQVFTLSVLRGLRF